MKLLVNIDVDDLEKGITFYQNALGLRLVRRLFDGTVAEMVGASSNVYLLTRASMMSDPFGHGFCLLQFIGRGYDEVDERPSISRITPRYGHR